MLKGKKKWLTAALAGLLTVLAVVQPELVPVAAVVGELLGVPATTL